MRSVPPRPRVARLPSGAEPKKPGTTGVTPRRSSDKSRRRALRRVATRSGSRGSVSPIGHHDLGGVHALGPAAGGAKRRGEKGAGLALTPGHERIGGAGRKLGERRHRPRDVAILARGHVHRGQDPALGGARGQESEGQVAMPPEERRRDFAAGARVPLRGPARAVEQKVGDAPEG